jgi:hypothetical protein
MKGQEVVLIPQSAEGGAILWTMVHGGEVAQGGNYPAVDMPKGNISDNVIFTIVDVNKLGVTFDPKVVDNGSKPKALNAIWIAEGSGSPKAAGPYPGQIDSVKLQKAATQLIVGDKNSDDTVFTYQLNFVRGGQPVTSIDPEIRNGGGSKAQFFSLETVAVVLSLAVLVLAGIQLVSQLRNRRTSAQGPK